MHFSIWCVCVCVFGWSLFDLQRLGEDEARVAPNGRGRIPSTLSDYRQPRSPRLTPKEEVGGGHAHMSHPQRGKKAGDACDAKAPTKNTRALKSKHEETHEISAAHSRRSKTLARVAVSA